MIPSPEQFLSWQVNEETKHFEKALDILIDQTDLKFAPLDYLSSQAQMFSEHLAELLEQKEACLPVFIDEAHVFGLPDTLNGQSVITDNLLKGVVFFSYRGVLTLGRSGYALR